MTGNMDVENQILSEKLEREQIIETNLKEAKEISEQLKELFNNLTVSDISDPEKVKQIMEIEKILDLCSDRIGEILKNAVDAYSINLDRVREEIK